MIAVADNLNTRNKDYMAAVEARDSKTLSGLAKALSDAGADVINIQCSLDGSGDEDRLPWVLETVQGATDRVLCIDSRNIEAVKKALTLIKKPPLINYVSETEPAQRQDCFSLANRAKAYIVLRAARGGNIPTSFENKLQILETLLEDANRADIPNERLFLDPSLIHIGRGAGQDHIMNTHECILAIKEMVEPPVNTISWISNVSTGMSPRQARKMTEAGILTYLAGAGLDAALLDILDPAIRQSLYLIKSFRDEIVFSPADLLA
ncbi:MAG: dihydropteroate synthase [Nitrospiraceae bacterium]|nr:dihydropteroate synthase [Nitrospiraceae bacterium]